jgi:hypothetical protein
MSRLYTSQIFNKAIKEHNDNYSRALYFYGIDISSNLNIDDILNKLSRNINESHISISDITPFLTTPVT